MTGYPEAWVRLACQSGGARTKGGRIDIAKVKAWVDANAEKLEQSSGDLSLKDQKLVEEVRRLRLRNDRDAGRLVERAWIRERFHRYGGEIAAIRAKAEAEDPVKLSEAGTDIALIRSAYRITWDTIMLAHQEAAHHFSE